MGLAHIEALCVTPYTGPARLRRERLFYALEGVVQDLLNAHIRCDVFADGSFFTEKPEPDDIDIIVSIEIDVFEGLDEPQLLLIETLNTGQIALVDSIAVTTYPREHPYRGFGLDLESLIEGYGLEHAQVYLKGYAVLKLWETDVGNRICS